MAPSSPDAGPPPTGERRYVRPQHALIARVLRMLRTDVLVKAGCWFAGGTAIVMTHGEYRLSLDVDFLCSSQHGYSALRQAVTGRGVDGIFDQPVKALRDFRCDQYGLRTMIEMDGQQLKLEIVREGRIEVTGAYDPVLGCPLLSIDDQFAEKLLANADRGKDRYSYYRDAVDLGMLVLGNGNIIPEAASTKAFAAYGEDIWRDARWVVEHLETHPAELDWAADALQMEAGLARKAVAALGKAQDRRLPEARSGVEG